MLPITASVLVMNNNKENIQVSRVGFTLLIKAIVIVAEAQIREELNEDHINLLVAVSEKLVEEAIVSEFADELNEVLGNETDL